MEKVLITLSRQLGCGGAYLGQVVAKRLGYAYLDREILHQAARTLEVEESELANREERVSMLWEKCLSGWMLGSPESPYVPPPLHPVYDRDLFDVEARLIRRAADETDAVIVGRGGFHVLKGRPGLANVFIHAPIEFREKRLMEIYQIKQSKAARSLIDQSDRQRAKYIRTMTGADWTDSRNYHLCLDISKSGFSTAEEMILLLVNRIKQILSR